MKKIEFDYFDWEEFVSYLDSLPDKDAAKLLAVIHNIEEYGLTIAERQKWTKKLTTNLYEYVQNMLQTFNVQSIFIGMEIDT